MKKTLREGTKVIVKGYKKTEQAYGAFSKMDQYIETIQIVDYNSCKCGCIKLKDINNFVWHIDDLQIVVGKKKEIKPVLFNEDQIGF